MGVVNDAVQQGVGISGVADLVEPAGHRDLGDQDRRRPVMSITSIRSRRCSAVRRVIIHSSMISSLVRASLAKADRCRPATRAIARSSSSRGRRRYSTGKPSRAA